MYFIFLSSIFLSVVLLPLRLCRAGLFVVGQLLFLVHFWSLLEHERTLQ
jgi:hypothetical protein